MRGKASHVSLKVQSHKAHDFLKNMMLLLFISLMASAMATTEYESPYYVSTGNSQQYRTQDESGNYRFGYDESHPSGGTFRDETGDSYGNKWGSYGLHEADGRYRVVNYVADSQGFRAEIKSNEPGLAPTSTKTTVKKPYVEPTEQKPFIESEQKPYVESTVKKPFVETTAQKPFVEIQKPFVEVQKPFVEVQKPFVEVQKPVLYAAPVVHHPYNPEYPLLYHHNPYYASYGHYKGTPFHRYGSYYKGTPYVKRVAPIVTRHGYYVYP